MKLQITFSQLGILEALCKQFFNGYDNISISMVEKDSIHFREIICKQRVDTVPIPVFRHEHIHWFELCMHELPKRILKDVIIKHGRGPLDSHKAKMLKHFDDPTNKNNPHPVEYLQNLVAGGKHIIKW